MNLSRAIEYFSFQTQKEEQPFDPFAHHSTLSRHLSHYCRLGALDMSLSCLEKDTEAFFVKR